MTIKINNLIKFYILFLLVKKPVHGYKIIAELREKLDRKISANQVYPFLNLLKKNKLLIIKQKGEREKKVYALTKKGKEFAIETINRFGELIDIMMQPNLSVCVHCGCKIYKDYHKEKIKRKSMIFCCKHCAEAYKKYVLKLNCQFRIEQSDVSSFQYIPYLLGTSFRNMWPASFF